jgi:glutamine amidotransferase
MLFEHSEEGDVPGLGIFPGKVRRFRDADLKMADASFLKVPHMGWNQVWQKPHPLWNGIADGARFYFVHSYCVFPSDPALEVGFSEHGRPFTSAAGQANIFAVQFHPEKSARDGLQLLKNFIDWNP